MPRWAGGPVGGVRACSSSSLLEPKNGSSAISAGRAPLSPSPPLGPRHPQLVVTNPPLRHAALDNGWQLSLGLCGRGSGAPLSLLVVLRMYLVALRLGFGRIFVSETEVPFILVNLV